MKKRNISEDEILSTIKYPEKLNKIDDKYYSMKDIGRGRIEVVYEKTSYINIISVYWV